jgi:hypothetical protein
MKIRKVYKVVRVLGSKHLWSAFVGDIKGLAIKYTLGEWTEPAMGMLYAFKGSEAAHKFAKWRSQYSDRCVVYLAEAEVSRARPRMFSGYKFTLRDEHERVRAFWARRGHETDEQAPEDTVLCKRIKLIEEVKACHASD